MDFYVVSFSILIIYLCGLLFIIVGVATVIDSIKVLDDTNEEWLEVTQPLNAQQDLMFRHP